MILTTTNGKEELIPDMCSYCEISTAGIHEVKCSFYVNPYITIIIEGRPFVKFTYPDIIQDVIVL